MTHSRITLRHFALLAIVVVAGVLLGGHRWFPVTVRFPGLLVLGALGAWLLLADDEPSDHGKAHR